MNSFEVAGGITPTPSFSIRVAFFHNQVDNSITTVPAGNPSLPAQRMFTNGAQLKATGAETEVSGEWRRLTLRTSYTYVDSKAQANVAGSQEYATATVPQHMLNLLLTGNVGKHVRLGSSLAVRSDRPRDPGAPRPPVGGFAVWNANVSLRDFGVEGLEFQVTGRNLTDQTYYGPSSYPPLKVGVVSDDIPYRGAELMVGLKYRR